MYSVRPSTTAGPLMACLVELKMPPRSTSTWSSWTSWAAFAAACASSLALSSRCNSTGRPRMPPEALISSTTSVAVLAWAPPRGDRGPLWSAITPILISSRMTFLLRPVAAAELCHLGRALVPGFLHDRRDLGIGGETLPTLGVPVEDHPDPVVLIGVAEHKRTLRPVLLPLLGALRRENVLEAVEILDRRRCQECGHRCGSFRAEPYGTPRRLRLGRPPCWPLRRPYTSLTQSGD